MVLHPVQCLDVQFQGLNTGGLLCRHRRVLRRRRRHRFFFLILPLDLGELQDPSLKLAWRKIKRARYRINNPMASRYTTRITKKKMAYDYLIFFRRFWVKEPRHSENTFAKKRYTSIVACVHTPHETIQTQIFLPLHRVTRACPVTTDLITRVSVRTTTTTTTTTATTTTTTKTKTTTTTKTPTLGIVKYQVWRHRTALYDNTRKPRRKTKHERRVDWLLRQRITHTRGTRCSSSRCRTCPLNKKPR